LYDVAAQNNYTFVDGKNNNVAVGYGRIESPAPDTPRSRRFACGLGVNDLLQTTIVTACVVELTTSKFQYGEPLFGKLVVFLVLFFSLY